MFDANLYVAFHVKLPFHMQSIFSNYTTYKRTWALYFLYQPSPDQMDQYLYSLDLNSTLQQVNCLIALA